MITRDPRIDDYIAKSLDFAKPILNHIRKLVRAACPDVEETLKWGFPHFMHKGILCSMASFKNHCSFGFWKSALILGKGARETAKQNQAMGQFGRLTSLSDLPPDRVLISYIQEAVRLNASGTKLPSRPKAMARKELVIPPYFMDALKHNAKAFNTFENFTYSHKKEYVQWVTEAKREETRHQRLATAIVWLAQGKPRNWKYAGC